MSETLVSEHVTNAAAFETGLGYARQLSKTGWFLNPFPRIFLQKSCTKKRLVLKGFRFAQSLRLHDYSVLSGLGVMMYKPIVKKTERVEYANSPACTAYEYPLEDKDINVAFIEIDGRYPDKGRVTNEVVKELVFVVGGEGKIIIGEKELRLKEGDAVLVLPKQEYFFEGKFRLVVSCAPAWYPEQHKTVDSV